MLPNQIDSRTGQRDCGDAADDSDGQSHTKDDTTLPHDMNVLRDSVLTQVAQTKAAITTNTTSRGMAIDLSLS